MGKRLYEASSPPRDTPGGTCIKLESTGSRVLRDLGLPLDSPDVASAALPKVPGLQEPDANLFAIVLSHGHRDHWGLVIGFLEMNNPARC